MKRDHECWGVTEMNDGFEFRNHGLPDVQRVRLLRPGLAELLELCDLCGVRVFGSRGKTQRSNSETLRLRALA